jgi:hypothetical protein
MESTDENMELTLPFFPEEVGREIMEMKVDSTPGPDGLPIIFFQKFWERIQVVIMPMFQEFYIGALVMSRLNFGVITFIPNIVGATDTHQFRPITVINVIQRIFSKVCALRLALVMERLTHPSQFAFLKGRYIHDGILALHESIHEVKVRRLKGVFLNLDFQKAYDHLDWAFVGDIPNRYYRRRSSKPASQGGPSGWYVGLPTGRPSC